MIRRNKPLKRTPLKRNGPPKRSEKRLRHRSAKQEALYDERRPFVERILGERPLCEACPVFAAFDRKVTYACYPSADVHELIRRGQGGDILDDNNVLAVCRRCHDRIGMYIPEAEQCGLALPSWATVEMEHEALLRRSGECDNHQPPSWRHAPEG